MRQLVQTALAAAEAAAAVHGAYAGSVRADEARDKGTSDFVSNVDMEAQAAAVARIRQDFPDHRILAEEDDGSPPVRVDPDDPLPTWVVDPLDGTTNFLHRHPAHAASVGVVRRGRPVAGAVVASATGERWWAGEGEGAFRNGKPIRVSATRDLRVALVGTGFPFKLLDRLPDYLAQFERVLPASAGIRRCGSAALDLCYLAQGSLDAFWEIHLSPWDIAAGLCVLSEAGGTARSIEGGPVDLLRGGSVLAANSHGMLEALGERVRPPGAGA
jgi:myo-inositol-1(or 4)-monophosphatase